MGFREFHPFWIPQFARVADDVLALLTDQPVIDRDDAAATSTVVLNACLSHDGPPKFDLL